METEVAIIDTVKDDISIEFDLEVYAEEIYRL